MDDENKTNSLNETIVIENGKRVFPCRCGKTHKDDYAFEDWNHHNCLHEVDLLCFGNVDGTIQAICPDCGKAWKGIFK